MKVVILAGGYGTRIAEESDNKPKPMVEIGEMPILLHIMNYYSYFGHNEFIICCGYKRNIIEEFFKKSEDNSYKSKAIRNDWKVHIVDTGEQTMTGGRLKRIKKYINKNEDFLFTYGDGLSDVNIEELIDFHKKNHSICTVTAVFPPSRFGALEIDENNNKVLSFKEKPHDETQMINGGYFVLNEKIFNYILDDDVIWERDPMETLAKEGNLFAYKHRGFFGPMDTLRDKRFLETMWIGGEAKWKIWKD